MSPARSAPHADRPGRVAPALLDALTIGAGLLYPLSFAPFGWSPLVFVALAALFFCWDRADPGRAAWRGFLFGCGAFGLGVSWVYVSLHEFGNMPAPMAVVAVIGFVALLSAFLALGGWLQARLGRGAPVMVRWALVMPAAWVLGEWLKDWVMTGFPWLAAGYTQVGFLFEGFAPWLGVYGVSLVTASAAGCVAAGMLHYRTGGRTGLGACLALVVLGWGLSRIDWVEPVGEPLDVALVQGNVALADKWQPGRGGEIRDLYLERSLPLTDRDLVVWPESALPYYFDQVDPELWEILDRHPADFVLGILERQQQPERYYNSVVVVNDGLAPYRKRHLVPFGGFLPVKPVFGWVVDYLQIPMADFTGWEATQPALPAAGHRLGISVCYEDAFPLDVRRSLPQATVLVNVSEDAWFGDSFAPHQRLQMAQMRALETARPFLRAANTGVSAIIDPRGAVVARSPQFETYVLTGTVQPTGGVTPFVRYGNVPAVALMVTMLVAGWAGSRRRSRSERASTA